MTALATEIHAGDTIRLDNVFYKVIEADIHTGGGRSGSMVDLKLRHLETGHISEHRLAPTDRVDKIEVSRVQMEYLYAEWENFVFMNQQDYEQLSLPKAAIGSAALFLKEGMTIPIELFESRPLSVDFPKIVELKVESTGEGRRGDGSYKEAVLHNGMTLRVPQFIKEGDAIRVDVETQQYVDRVLEKTGIGKQVYKSSEKFGSQKPS